MAIGDFDDIILRFNAYLVKWFGKDPPLVDSIIEGYAEIMAFLYASYAYVKEPTRIKTATDDNLDAISFDFFGGELPRKGGETDTHYRNRILIYLLREKATREGMRKILLQLTGFEPIIIEPFRPLDTGAYNEPHTLSYNTAGVYSSMNFAYQAFITVFRPLINGLGNFAALNVTNHGYNVVQSPTKTNPVLNAYGSLALMEGYVTNADIYNAVETTRMNSTRIWVEIVDKEVA